jgi:hypothetical protein
MLSGAKHLLFLIETNKSRSFAGAQDDIGGSFFISLLAYQRKGAGRGQAPLGLASRGGLAEIRRRLKS